MDERSLLGVAIGRAGARAPSLEILPDSAALAARPRTAHAADGGEEHHGQIDERWGTVCNGAGSCEHRVGGWAEEEEQRIYR